MIKFIICISLIVVPRYLHIIVVYPIYYNILEAFLTVPINTNYLERINYCKNNCFHSLIHYTKHHIL